MQPTARPILALVACLTCSSASACSEPADARSDEHGASGGQGGSGHGGSTGTGGTGAEPTGGSGGGTACLPAPAPGSGWTVFQEGGNDYHAVWGRSADEVWVVGDYRIVSFDGCSATTRKTGAGNDAVWPASDTSVWVGSGAEVLRVSEGTMESFPVAANILAGTTFPTGWAIAVGYPAAIATWNDDWKVDSEPFDESFNAVWGLTSSDFWMGGSFLMNELTQNPSPATTLLHYVGGQGTPVALPVDHGEVHAIWGAATDDIHVAMSSYTIVHGDGKSWQVAFEQPTDSFRAVRSIHGTAADDVWAVGEEGFVAHHNGSGWSASPVAPEIWLDSVWAAAPDDAWAVGRVLEPGGSSHGVILRYR